MKQLNLITHSRKKTALFVFQSYLRKIIWLLHNFKEFYNNSYMDFGGGGGGILLIESTCPNSSQFMKLKCS